MKDKYKHLTLDQRMEIQLGLKAEKTLEEIATSISKSPRTVSFEIKRALKKTDNNRYQFVGKEEKSTCPKHLRFPYVCGKCELKSKGCLSDFYSYDAKYAQKLYETKLVDTRLGLNLTYEEITTLNEVLVSGVKNGQSLEHIFKSNELPCSIRSAYRYILKNELKVHILNMRMKPRLKKRKVLNTPKKHNLARLQGRLYTDYLKNPGRFRTQLDCVIGAKSDTKVLMTIFIVETHFFYAILLERQHIDEVKRAFDDLEGLLGLKDFRKLFPDILTDRGFEFSNPDKIELSIEGYPRTKLYYCDPQASHQKGSIESIHRMVRYVFPKGKSLDFLTQEKLDIFISHVNSYRVKTIGYETPYNLMTKIFGKDVLDKLKVKELDPDQIHLTPLLVK